MTSTVHLVRHGEVEHHRADVSLTGRGREQARQAGTDLAAQIAEGEAVIIRYSPVRRVQETAEILYQSLARALQEVHRPGVTLQAPAPDLALSNVRFILGSGQEPAEPSLLYAETALPAEGRAFAPEQAAFYRGFWASQDPMGYWLASGCGTGVETPAVVWERLRARLARIFSQDGAAAGTHWVLVTHSGALRLLLRQAIGSDPGEPRFCESVRLEAAHQPGSVRVVYRERAADLRI
jgi:broad specificity phosphatase PhoE